MRIITLATIVLLSSTLFAVRTVAQQFDWEASGGAAGLSNSFSGALDLARDPEGNLFLFNDANTDQQCQGDTVVPIGGPGSTNTFVHKFNAAGELQWIRPVGPQFQPFSIRCDDAGNAYLLGRTSMNTITLEDTTLGVTASRNYLLKFSPEGDLVWLNSTGMPLTGGFGRTTLLHHAAGKLYFQSGNLSIACIDTAGNPVASFAASSYVPQTAFPNLWFKNAVSLSNGDIVVAGEHLGELAFGEDPSQPGEATAAALNRYFFLRLGAELDTIHWYRSHGHFKDRMQFTIPLAVDPSDNIYTSATLGFNSPITFGPDQITNSTLGNGIDAILKMDADGTPQWMRAINSSASTYAYGLTLKDDGNSLYLCGRQTSSTATFGSAVIQASGTGGGFIAEITTDGDYTNGFPTGVPAQLPNALQSFSYALVAQGDGRYVVSGQLSTISPWEMSCVERIPNRGFFVTEFTGLPDEVPMPQITQEGQTLIASPVFDGTIQWLLNGEPIAGANGQSYDPMVSGAYSVTYTNEIGCVGTATSEVLVVITTGQDGATSAVSSLEAWPNPTEGQLLLRGLPPTGTAQIAIYDAMGRTVAAFTATGGNAAIDIGALQSGVYWLRAIEGEARQALRIVRQ
ncbi:MAG: T9SS type A sorting domain-containing protein [Flavobacteriales bacterium]